MNQLSPAVRYNHRYPDWHPSRIGDLKLKRVLGLMVLLFSLTGCQLSWGNVWPEPVPEDWLTHSDPEIGYSVSYPPEARVVDLADSTSPPHRMSSLIIVPDFPAARYVIKIHSLRNRESLPLKDFLLTPLAQTFNNLYFGKWPLKSPEAYDQYIKPVKVAGGYPALTVEENEETYPLTSGCKNLIYIGHKDLVILSMLCVDGRTSVSAEPQPGLVELHTRISNTIRFD